MNEFLKKIPKHLFSFGFLAIWLVMAGCITKIAPQQSFTLTRESIITIVTPTNPTPTVSLAVDDLARILNKSLSCRINKQKETEPLPTNGTIFVVGPCGMTPPALLKELDIEEYARKIEGRFVYLAGHDSSENPTADFFAAKTPTYYAVADFLKDYMGVRWLWPGETGEVVPRHESILLKGESICRKPFYQVRTTGYYHGSLYPPQSRTALVLWGRRNGMGSFKFGWGGHADLMAVGTNCFTTNPELYALVEGKRQNLLYGGYGGKLCHANPEVARLFADWGASSKYEVVSVSPNDGRSWCECEKCRRLDGENAVDSNGYPITSGRVFDFANRVARLVVKRHIPKPVYVFAYGDYVSPPRNIKRLETNVWVWTAQNIKSLRTAELQRQFHEFMEDWSVKANQIALRDYWDGSFGSSPPFPAVVNPWPHVTAREFEWLKNKKWFKGIDVIGDDSRDYALSGPTHYLYANLLWNPQRKANEIISGYYQSGWPGGHEYIRAYYELFQSAVDGYYQTNHAKIPLEKIAKVYTDDLLSRADKLLCQAEKAAVSDEEKRRAEFVRTGYECMRLELQYLQFLFDLAEIGVSGLIEIKPAKVEKVSEEERRARIKRAAEIKTKRESFLKEKWDSEAIPAPPSIHKMATGNSALGVWNAILDSLAGELQFAGNMIPINDPWKFRLDPSDAGKKNGWHLTNFDDSGWADILTTDFWEKQGYGPETDPRKGDKSDGYNGVAWYRHGVDIPAIPAESFLVHLGAVDESCWIYVNGKLSGSFVYDEKKDPNSWLKPRVFDITDAVIRGAKNIIVVKVLDQGGCGGIWRPCSLEIVSSNLLQNGSFETGLSGWSVSADDLPAVKTVSEEKGGQSNLYAQIDGTLCARQPVRLITGAAGLEGNSIYRLEVALRVISWDGKRAVKGQDSFYVRICFRDAAGKWLPAETTTWNNFDFDNLTSREWKFMTTSVKVPSKAAGCVLTFFVNYPGIFGLDNIELRFMGNLPKDTI